jgi:hypothetical protein
MLPLDDEDWTTETSPFAFRHPSSSTRFRFKVTYLSCSVLHARIFRHSASPTLYYIALASNLHPHSVAHTCSPNEHSHDLGIIIRSVYLILSYFLIPCWCPCHV